MAQLIQEYILNFQLWIQAEMLFSRVILRDILRLEN